MHELHEAGVEGRSRMPGCGRGFYGMKLPESLGFSIPAKFGTLKI